MSVPLFSIITVVYNGEDHIEECIQSVLDQNYSNIEYIIIDGGSTDNTNTIIEKYSSKLSYYVSEPDKGIYDAMNKGLKKATGDFIGILNADDYFFKNTTLEVVNAFSSSNADVIYGDIQKLKIIDSKKYFITEKPDLNNIERTMSIFHPATFIKRSVYDSIGYFDTKYRFSADYDLIYRIYKKACKFHYLETVLTVFRTGGASALNCSSYEEGLQILIKNKSPYINDMKNDLEKCRHNVRWKKAMLSVISIFHLKSIYNSYLNRKWSKKAQIGK